jgi:hypothetical protein
VRQAVVLPLIAKHSGHIIDTAGDGILAEFPSVVNAVECAAAVQNVMAERNSAGYSSLPVTQASLSETKQSTFALSAENSVCAMCWRAVFAQPAIGFA